MNCFQCSKQFHDFSQLFRHFRHLHGLPSNGSEIICTFGDCPRVFMSFQRFKDHALSQHRDIFSTELPASSTVGFLCDDSSHDNDDTTSSSHTDVELVQPKRKQGATVIYEIYFSCRFKTRHTAECSTGCNGRTWKFGAWRHRPCYSDHS